MHGNWKGTALKDAPQRPRSPVQLFVSNEKQICGCHCPMPQRQTCLRKYPTTKTRTKLSFSGQSIILKEKPLKGQISGSLNQGLTGFPFMIVRSFSEVFGRHVLLIQTHGFCVGQNF